MPSRLGQPSSSSRSNSPWRNFDGAPADSVGAQDKTSNALLIQDTPATQDASTYRRERHPGRVADRIRAINDLHRAPNVPVSKDPRSTTHHVPPSKDSVKHVPPFSRRDASQSPVRPETPMVRSRMPVTSPYLHCPMPNRVQPHLPNTIERGVIGSRQLDQSTCHRHGRKLQHASVVAAGLQRGIGGAYIPTGHRVRYQVDAASPWSVAWKPLAKTEGTIVSPEICPDCLAEQEILDNELEHGSRASSTNTERRSPDLGISSNVLVGTTLDNQTATIPGATVSGMPTDQFGSFGSIIAADLGGMIDAIIIEHSGTLDKVVTNLRNGVPGIKSTKELSGDLAKVSQAMADLPRHDFKQIPAFSRDHGGSHRRSMIFDASPEHLRKSIKTVPELLDLIDATAEQFGGVGNDQDGEDSRIRAQKTSAGDDDIKLCHLPGNFPPSTFVTPLCGTPASPPLSSSPDEPTPPLPATPVVESLRTPDTSLQPNADRFNDTSLGYTSARFDTPAIVVDPPNSDLKHQEVPFKAAQPSASGTTSSRQEQSDATFFGGTSLSRPSRVSKVTNLPIVKRLFPSASRVNGNHRTGPIKLKPSEVASQQREQRTFQQGWLRDASKAERDARRSRSRI